MHMSRMKPQLNKMLLPLLFLTLLALARGDTSAGKEEEADNILRDERDPLAFETFGSPVYGAYPYGGSLLGARPAYGYPSYPGSYGGYFNNPYAYGRYTSLPGAFPSMAGYGSPLQNGYGYSTPLQNGYGYSTPLSRYGALGSPYYPGADRLRYPAYPVAGLGFRYGGPAYVPPAPIKGSPAARVDSPVVGRAAALPRYAAPVPPPYPFPAPVPVAPLPPPAAYGPYRAAVRATQAKDGSLRYPDGPVDVTGLQFY